MLLLSCTCHMVCVHTYIPTEAFAMHTEKMVCRIHWYRLLGTGLEGQAVSHAIISPRPGIELRVRATEHTRKSPTQQTYPPSKPLLFPYLTRKVMQLFFVQADVLLLGRLRFSQDQILEADDERAVGDFAVFAVLANSN